MEIVDQIQTAEELIINTGVNVFLTGRAGTGKTTFLRKIKELKPKRMVVLAPTGIAAINAGGSTLHSFFQLPFGLYLPGYTKKSVYKMGREKINIIRSLDLLVIDEISMVRADLLDEVSHVLQRYRYSDKPFGGVQLLMIGDLQQLAPIVKEDERAFMQQYYPSPFFFESKALKEVGFVCVELEKIFRQSDPEFIALLERIRNKNPDFHTMETLNKRFDPNFKLAEGYITLTTHNSQAKAMNYEELNKLKGLALEYDAEIEGTFPEYSYPTEAKLMLKKGAQVMFVKNDSSVEKRFFNGKIGKIVDLSAKMVKVECNGEVVEVRPETWDNARYSLDELTKEIKEVSEGKFVQLPLKLAWAITIHKSQGLTFDKVIIDASLAFAHGQVYVALSRCRSLQGLVLRSLLDTKVLIPDATIDDFTQQAVERAVQSDELEAYKKTYYMGMLLEQFDFSALWHELTLLSNFSEHFFRVPYRKLYERIIELTQIFGHEIKEVGEHFEREIYTWPKMEKPEEYRNDRCHKASVYFLEKIETLFLPFLPRLLVDLDNVSAQKNLQKIKDRLCTEFRIKQRTLLSCKLTKKFEVPVYSKVKALACMDINEKKNSSFSSKVVAKSVGSKANIKGANVEAVHVGTLDPNSLKAEDVNESLRQFCLLEKLKTWRMNKAEAEHKKTFQILHQSALFEIANQEPISMEDLLKIKGIGKVKLKSYGEDLLKIIRGE